MRRRTIALHALGAGLAWAGFAPAARAQDPRYLTHAELSAAVERLASEHARLCSAQIIGTSREGRAIHGLRLALPGPADPDKRPALLLAANIDGDHLVGSAVALEVARRMADAAGKQDPGSAAFLEGHTLYVVPRVNPDAAERFFDAVRLERRRNLRPDDRDRDGAIDEDPPNDVNGDGLITMMRVYDPQKADMMPDPQEPRLDVKPDRDKGERALYTLMVEGADDDNDGEYNEDPAGGVDLNANYMHGYQQHADGAGPYQVSEPESLALLEFVLAHQNIAAVLVYGVHDNLSRTPEGKATLPAGTPRDIDGKDAGLYGFVGEQFRRITGLEKVPGVAADGAFFAWAYAQFGVPSFSTPLWTRPEPPKEEPPAEGKEGAPAASPPPAPPAGAPAPPSAAAPPVPATAAPAPAGAETPGAPPGAPGAAAPFPEAPAARPEGPPRPGGRRARGAAPSAEPPAPAAGEDQGEEGLTPSGIGDISQETIDELRAAAEASGFQVTDDMVAQITAAQVEQFAKQMGIPVRRVRAERRGGGGKAQSAEEAAWLKYSDEVRGGEGFVPWQKIRHSQLGEVEVGGWVPYFKVNPPPAEVEAIAGRQLEFVLDLAGRLPRVSAAPVEVVRLAAGLYEVKLSLVNDGYLPTGTAMAQRNRRARPHVVRLSVPEDQVVSGQRVNKVWSIPGSGGRISFRWIVRAPDGTPLTITVFSEKFGQFETAVTLAPREGGAP